MIDYETYTAGENDEVLVMVMLGRLDTDSSQFLLDCVKSHVESGARKIVLDCQELQYISSFGLATIVGAATSLLKDSKGAVALAQVPGLVAEVIRVTHLDKLFHVFPTIEKAVESFE